MWQEPTPSKTKSSGQGRVKRQKNRGLSSEKTPVKYTTSLLPVDGPGAVRNGMLVGVSRPRQSVVLPHHHSLFILLQPLRESRRESWIVVTESWTSDDRNGPHRKISREWRTGETREGP